MITPASVSALTFIRQDVQSMHAYAVQNSQGMVKLDAMENPFSLDSAMQAKLGMALGEIAINRYPAQHVADLKTTLKDYVNLPSSSQLILGNGSDELIALLALACVASKDKPRNTILAPIPSFIMYEMSAQLHGLDFVGIPLTSDFELDEMAMLLAIEAHKPAITYIAYPNNPTANLWDANAIKKIIISCSAYGGLVVIDEAYQPFSSLTWLDNMRANPSTNTNVILMRTLSKFGLAGVRLGYMLGNKAVIDQIDKLRPPYNVSSLNAQAGIFALNHKEVFAKQAAIICRERLQLIDALTKLPGVTPYKSNANMILARFPNADATFNKLLAKKILTKNVSKMHPLLANCLRLTVGTPDENTLLLKELGSDPN